MTSTAFKSYALRALLICLLAPALASADDASLSTTTQSNERDPWEGFNRKVFAFNDALDGALLKPVSKGYKAVVPNPVRNGVRNFFENLQDVPNLLNHILQADAPDAFVTGGRLILNTTIGIGGLFDVATDMGLDRRETDSGLTLATWGVGSGPFVMLPFLGPSTVRDGVGDGVDLVMFYPVSEVDDPTLRWSLRGLEFVGIRADLLDAEELITGDRYVFLREAYLQNRTYQVTGELPEDDFGDEEFGDDDW